MMMMLLLLLQLIQFSIDGIVKNPCPSKSLIISCSFSVSEISAHIVLMLFNLSKFSFEISTEVTL